MVSFHQTYRFLEIAANLQAYGTQSCSMPEIQRNPHISLKDFLGHINVDIGTGLPTTARGSKHFVLIKNDKWDMMWIYCCKDKSEIFKTVVEFKT